MAETHARVWRRYLDTPEGQIHYREAGDGEPLILLHQTANSSAIFEPMLPLFAAKGRRVVAFDTPGFGASDPPPEPPDIAYYARRFVEAAALLGINQFDLLGHHTGATAGARIAADFGAKVCHLVLWGYPMLTPEQMAQLANAEPVEFSDDGSFIPASWQQVNGPRVQPKLTNRFLLERLQAGRNAYWSPRAVGREDHAALARRISIPTLIISHESDPSWEGSQGAAVLIPNAQFVPVRGVNVDVADAAMQQFVDTVDAFLNGGDVRA